MSVSDEIKEAISEVVRERFVGDLITSVNVSAAEGSDGDPIFKVFVVFESASGKDTLDEDKMLGLVRHIMQRLESMNVDEFPLVSFVSKKDAAKLNFATA
jgi:hypothetical protein